MPFKPKILAVIPARGGSKGLPRKNILPLAGKPLIAWTIEAAANCGLIDHIVVSTDSEEIAKVSTEYGADVPFLRPASLAMDATPGIEVVLHAIEELPDYDIVALLQPTSSLRDARDVSNSLRELVDSNALSCLSVCAFKLDEAN